MFQRLKKYPELWFLTLAGFLTRLLWLGTPREVVFDEVHFGKFLSAYFKGETFFDIHPPLGKLLYAAIAWLRDFQPGFDFDHIGEAYAGVPIVALRLLPAVLGALLVPLVYLIARELGLSRPAATLAAGFVLFDNALVTQSRFMLLDIPLLFFGFSSILFFLLGEKVFLLKAGREWPARHHWLLFSLSAISLALAVSIKWTALAFYVPLLLLFIEFTVKAKPSKLFQLLLVILFLVVPALLYGGFFALHFLLTEPAKLQTFLKSHLFLQAQMFGSNLQALTHPYQSTWWQWPWLGRSVFYWQSAPGGVAVAWLYLLGNPFVWWMSGVAVALGVFLLTMPTLIPALWRKLTAISSHPERSEGSRSKTAGGIKMGSFGLRPQNDSSAVILSGTLQQSRPTSALAFLYISYLANLLPFMAIHRAMFLYHYFPALIFSFLILGVLADRVFANDRRRWLFVTFALLTALVFFLHFAPLSYGLRINENELNARMWLTGWR